MKNVAVIMAGGKGERFWPVSRKNLPKQFIALTDSHLTMIQLAVERINKIIAYEDIYIITNENYQEIVYDQLQNIPKENIILEPLSRNTAPCLALATTIIKKKYQDANVIVLAADHHIKNVNLFIDSINIGIENLTDNNIITLGIIPTRIDTGYGYIELGERKNTTSVYQVSRFVEKPNYNDAKSYYESGNYLWNSGMFIYRNSFLEKCLEKYVPELSKSMKKIEKVFNTSKFKEVLEAEYKSFSSTSIDYAIMEKEPNILVIPGNFGWDDVGSWLSVERLKPLDKNNNILDGEIISLNSNNNIIINNNAETIVATLGIDNTIIVNNQNCIMVLNKDSVGDIKSIINEIKNENKDIYL